jgi:hypothetical protein
MSVLLLPAQFDGYTNKKDKSVVLRFITQEQSAPQIAHIHGMLDEFGALMFKGGSEITQAEKAELSSLDTDLYDNPRTQSQRIRASLYVLWQQKPEGFTDFPGYYKFKTDRIIQGIKDQMDQ